MSAKPIVKIFTAYVPLDVLHVAAADYHAYYREIVDAVGAENVRCFRDRYEDLRLVKEGWRLPNAVPGPVPADRYASVEANVRSNVVQHNRTAWALRAAAEEPEVDVWIWLDYGITKQGRDNPDVEGEKYRPVTKERIRRFFDRVGARPPVETIPFPGIDAYGGTFRFCGSTHVWPTRFLPTLDAAYRLELATWLDYKKTLPFDLPIWSLVEDDSDGVYNLPFRFYPAEYGASQLDNWPEDVE